MAGSTGLAGTELLERGEELARIQQAITALENETGGVLLIQGAAGIGKSVLLRALCEQATGRGVQTFTARASELERDFGFGIVRQLLERRLVRAPAGEQAELLAGAASLAGPVLGLGGAVGDSFAALHGLYWLLANLTLNGSVVLAVDDLHWADEPSLRWLIYLCQRLDDLPVLVAASTHPPRPGHTPLLAELLAVGNAQFLCPRPLSEPAVGQLLCDGLGSQPDPAFVFACAQATAGNPFVLRELILDLAADNIVPSADQAVRVAKRIPARVERVVLSRLARLPDPARWLAQAVAVLGEGSALRLAAALADLDIDAAAAAVDVLVAAELLAEGPPLRFVHPLVRSAIYEQLPAGRRSQAHSRAAEVLASDNAEAEHVAGQLLATEPSGNPDAVQALRAAAATALHRGAPESAIGYLRRALTEPPTESVRAAVLGDLGGTERIARDPAAAAHLEQAWQATTDPIERARLADQLANVLFFTGECDRCLSVLQAGLTDLGDRDPDLGVRLHAHKAGMELLLVRPAEIPEVTLDELRELAGQSSPSSREAKLTLAFIFTLRGENCQEVAGLVESGWDDGRFLAEETCEAMPVIFAVAAYTLNDDLDRAHALADAMMADARARGSVIGFLSATGRRGLIALRRGALAEAEADIRTSLEAVTEHTLTLAVPVQSAYLGTVLLERGKLDQATAAVEQSISHYSAVAPSMAATLLDVRGRVLLARGQRAEAIADLRQCGQLAQRLELHNPNLFGWRSTLALALAADRPDEARALAQEELELARQVGSRRAMGIALRVIALLPDAQDRIETLQQSVAVLEPTPMRLELAHSLTELGSALRRAGTRNAARDPLRRALDLAARCGATPLVERAREEALAAGARPRRPWASGVHALTPSELRVARLAAQSWGNREIAQALFITTKTVSDHLTSAYRKLNISSRDQLATAMK